MLLKIDLTNAFNSLDRTTFLRSALDGCPSVFNYPLFAYGRQAPLFVGGQQKIWSQTGTHHGCPLACWALPWGYKKNWNGSTKEGNLSGHHGIWMPPKF